MKLEILVVFAALTACVAFVIWSVEIMRENNAREREARRVQCASKGGHLHCPYRADCLCLAPGMVVPGWEKSSGARGEVEWMRSKFRPVCHSIEDLAEVMRLFRAGRRSE